MTEQQKRSIRDIPLKNKYVDIDEERSDLKTDEIPTHAVPMEDVGRVEKLAHDEHEKIAKHSVRQHKAKTPAKSHSHAHSHKKVAPASKSIDGQLHHTHKDFPVEPVFYQAGQAAFDDGGEIETGHQNDEGGKRGIIWWVLGGIAVLAVLFFLLHTFSHAKISIVRSAEIVTLNDESFLLGTDLDYKEMKFDIIASTSISASGTETSSVKAKGQVVIYNESGGDQKLVSGTRLEAANGKLFRLTVNLTVPAATTVNKKSVPGNITANVVADEGGESYNIPLTDFTFPGFKGIVKFETIYGRSKTVMSGGGVVNGIKATETDMAAAKGLLQVQLNGDAEAKAASLSTEDYAYIPGSLNLSSDKIIQSYDAKTKSAMISQHGTATFVLIDKMSLAKVLAVKSQIFNASSSITALPMIESWDLSGMPLKSSPPASITISGSSTIVVSLDPDQVASAVSHLSRDSALRVIQHIPGVEAVEISVTPWWERALPGAGSIAVHIE